MKRTIRRVFALLVATAVVVGVAALSRVSYAPAGSEDAVLRLSWRVRGERVEECRKLTEAELAALPIHMRRSEVCEGRVLPYHLHVEVDGRTLADDTIHAAGAREDRPIYVYREVPIGPGAHQLSVRFVQAPRGGGSAAGAEDGGAGDPLTPRRLELTEAVRLRPGDVALVTYDPDRRVLVVRLPDPHSESGTVAESGRR